jgi:hypothetical protein
VGAGGAAPAASCQRRAQLARAPPGQQGQQLQWQWQQLQWQWQQPPAMHMYVCVADM